MKIYGGYIDKDVHHYEVFCVNCTVEGEKIWIEKPEGLSSVVYMTTYPCTYITKSSLNILKTDEVHYDELLEKSKLEPKVLNTLLMRMELKGMISKVGNYYSK